MRIAQMFAVALLLACWCANSFGETKFDADAFEKLPPHARFAFVQSVLRDRDAAISNLRYTVHEHTANLRRDTGAVVRTLDSEYTVRRLHDDLWMHLQFRDTNGTNHDVDVTCHQSDHRCAGAGQPGAALFARMGRVDAQARRTVLD